MAMISFTKKECEIILNALATELIEGQIDKEDAYKIAKQIFKEYPELKTELNW